jgi:hypothetical protein
MSEFTKLGKEIGEVVDLKNKFYGNAFERAGEVLKIFFPNGVTPNQYIDMLAIVRILDKLFRIATNAEKAGEDAYKDIAGYGLLGWRRLRKEDDE